VAITGPPPTRAAIRIAVIAATVTRGITAPAAVVITTATVATTGTAATTVILATTATRIIRAPTGVATMVKARDPVLITAGDLVLTRATQRASNPPVLLADRVHLLAMPALSGGSPGPSAVMGAPSAGTLPRSAAMVAAVPAVTAPAEGAEKPEALPTC
jgi:hypothetical protein